MAGGVDVVLAGHDQVCQVLQLESSWRPTDPAAGHLTRVAAPSVWERRYKGGRTQYDESPISLEIRGLKAPFLPDLPAPVLFLAAILNTSSGMRKEEGSLPVDLPLDGLYPSSDQPLVLENVRQQVECQAAPVLLLSSQPSVPSSRSLEHLPPPQPSDETSQETQPPSLCTCSCQIPSFETQHSSSSSFSCSSSSSLC